MAHPILMPRPGQMTEECVLVAWHKREGEAVHRGDVLFEIETDKSVMDVESFEEGVLLKRVVEEGQTVPVNAVCAYVGQPGEAIPEAPPPVAAAAPPVPAAPAAPSTAVAAGVAASAAATTVPVAAAGASERLRISPRASRLAAQAGIDPRLVTGSGPGGRITERDVRAALEAGGPATTGGAAGQATAGTLATPTPVGPVDGEEEPRPLSRMRRVIAERLTLSHTTIPTFTITVAVDVTALMAARAELKAAGTDLTVTDFVLAATAQSLIELPDVNARTDGLSVWPRRHVHLGLAVALPAGLVVAVIREAERLSVRGIHDRAGELIRMAREGTLPVDDMTGSTFTVSNLGMLGVDEFQAIINPGESAILAVASAVATPVVVGEGIAIRQIMKLTLTADHRLVDGELGARFLNAIRRRLEDVAGLRTIT